MGDEPSAFSTASAPVSASMILGGGTEMNALTMKAGWVRASARNTSTVLLVLWFVYKAHPLMHIDGYVPVDVTQ